MSAFCQVYCSSSSIGCASLGRYGQRAWPPHGIYQCTLPARKCEGRRNTDVAILLSTPGTLHILCLLITQTLEKHCVNGNRKVWKAACNSGVGEKEKR